MADAKKKSLAELVGGSGEETRVVVTQPQAFERALLGDVEQWGIDDIAKASAMLALMEKELKGRRKHLAAHLTELMVEGQQEGAEGFELSESGKSVGYEADGAAITMTLPVSRQLSVEALQELFESKGLPEPMWELAVPKSRKPKVDKIDELIQESGGDRSDYWEVGDWVIDESLRDQLVAGGYVTADEIEDCFEDVQTNRAPVLRVTPGSDQKELFKELLGARKKSLGLIKEDD